MHHQHALVTGQATPMDQQPDHTDPHYALVARAIEFIRERAVEQPSLEEIAAHVGFSQYHLQRLFAQWAGVSPKRFLQYLTKEHATAALRRSADVLGVSLAVGLSAPSRLHDLIVTCEAMTPGEVKTLGAGVTIGHGCADTPFGSALFGWTARGVCYLEFLDANHVAKLAALKTYWCGADFVADDAQAARLATMIFPQMPLPGKLHLVLRGTNFQVKVWEALLRTGPSDILSYAQLAARAGAPRAPRAVGSALAANMLGYLIPCHRVIRGDYELGNYRWGLTRKAALLAWESAKVSANR